MIRYLLALVWLLVFPCSAVNAKDRQQWLHEFSSSPNPSVRLHALLHIKRNMQEFAPAIASVINGYSGEPGLIENQLYLCLLIDQPQIVPALLRLYRMQEVDEAWCIYCCALRLVLQDYYLKGLWDPHGAGLTSGQLHELTLSGMDLKTPQERLVIEGNITDQKTIRWLHHIRSSSVGGLIKVASNPTSATMQRVDAADELCCRSPNGATTVQLIWLATIPSSDAAGEYACSLHGAILRNTFHEREKH